MPAAFHAKAIVVGVCGCGGVWLELVEACERWSSVREALSGKSKLDLRVSRAVHVTLALDEEIP